LLEQLLEMDELKREKVELLDQLKQMDLSRVVLDETLEKVHIWQ
jgi:hypothetical protein